MLRWRSSWILRMFTTSAPSIASSTLFATLIPKRSTSIGIMVEGPAIVTLAPSLVSPQMLERATRLCAMSPMMATRSPATFPRRSRIVKMSRSPCVGCSCVPSPALITPASRFRAR